MRKISLAILAFLPTLFLAGLIHSARFDQEELAVHFRFGLPCDSLYVSWIEVDYIRLVIFNKIGVSYGVDCRPTGAYVTKHGG